MVTRKTRFVSGLAAIFMLISMLTVIVLPASAVDDSPYPYVRDMETLGRDSTYDWGIGSAEDWYKAIELNENGESFKGLTLHFTADIDFDVDGSGAVEPNEYISPLGTDTAFEGSIHGHGHVIKNLYINHDITTDGGYVGLVGNGAGSTAVFRDLGLASGKITITGTASTVSGKGTYNIYTGAFMGRHSGTIVYANCWTDVDIEADVKAYEIDMAPFGRLGVGKLINCNNTGDLSAINDCTTTKSDGSASTGATRVDALYDWGASAGSEVINCYSVCNMTGSGKYLFSFGSWAKDNEQFIPLAEGVRNTYASGIGNVTNKSGLNKLLDGIKVDYDEVTSGELACKMNENYDSTYDATYGHKYYMIKDGRIAFTDDPYEALYKLTVSKKIGDYVVESNTFYHNAVSTVTAPVYDGYELSDYTESVFLLDDGTFRMPAENAELVYTASEPDWTLIEEMIEKYKGYKTSGQHKILVNGAGVLELLDKLEMAYAAKDTMSKEIALKRIALYVEQDRNLDVSLKPNLTYPDYPYLRNFELFGRDVSTEWAVADPEDWLHAIELSNDGEDFAGLNIHFVNDIDFNNQKMTPLCPVTNFAGDIDGHGYVLKNINIDVVSNSASTQYIGLIGRATDSSVVKVIKNLGIASGTVIGRSVASEAFTGAFMGHSYNTYFINCWNAASVSVVDAEDATNPRGVASMIGRVGTGTEGALINCYNLGAMTEDSTVGSRAAAFADWIKGPFDIINCFNAGTISGSLVSTGVNYNSTSHYGNAVIKNFYSVGSSELITIGSTLSVPDNVDSVGKVLEDETIASGELAWLMNNGYVDPTPYLPAGETAPERPYYVVKDGMIAIGSADEQPVRVAVVSAESTSYFYTLLNKPVDLNGEFAVGTPVYELADSALGTLTNGVLTVTTAPSNAEKTVVVNMTFAGGLDYAGLNDAIAAYDDVTDFSGYVSTKTNKALATLLNEVKTKTYTAQNEIDNDVELLNSYSFIISIQEYENNKDADGYSVASKADMDILADIFANLTEEQTVYITADIDMEGSATAPNTLLSGLKASIDGMDHTISNLYVTNAWLGDYAGASIKNLTIKDSIGAPTAATTAFLINTVKKITKISNVTLDNVTVNHGATGAGIYGLMIARISDGDLTLEDITVINSTFNRGDLKAGSSSTYCNSGIVLGKTYAGKLAVDGLYLNNNTITGNRSGSGTGVAFGEIICSATIKNVGIFNTTAQDNLQRGVLTTMIKENTSYEKQPVFVIENVIALNNGETVNLIGTDETYKSPITVKNAYTDTTKIVAEEMDTLTMTDCVTTAGDVVASGEAAYKINATGTEKTWAMVDGTPVFAEEGAVVKVTFKSLAGADLNVLYTDAEGKLIGLTDTFFDSVSAWDGYATKTELEAATFTADTVIKQAECNHIYNTVANGDGTHTTTCTAPGGCGASNTEACTYTYATSTDGVSHVKTCGVCGDIASESCTITLTHKDGTANAESKHTAACGVCGYSAEAACVFTSQYVEHTSEVKGYTKYTCACTYSYNVEDAEFNHDFSAVGTVVKKPTYPTVDSDGKGMSEIECPTCGTKKYDEIPALTLAAGTAGIVVKAPETATDSDTIEVTLEIANNPGIAGLNLAVTYDPAVLTLTGVADGGLFGQFIGPKGGAAAANGTAALTFLNVSNLNAAETDGKALVTLTFDVVDGAAFGFSDIAVEMIKGTDPADTENTGAANENGEYVTVYGSSTMVEIVDYLWGDADGDGVTGIPDALAILQWKVGLIEDSALKMEAADADRGGDVGIPDALLILQWKVGLVNWDPNGTTQEPNA